MGLMLVPALILAALPLAAGTAYATVAAMCWVQARRDYAERREHDPAELARIACTGFESSGTRTL